MATPKEISLPIAVIGNWELSWNTPIKESELWSLPLRDFGVSDWRMWPVSGIRNNEQRKVELAEYPDLDAALAGLDHLPRVFFEPHSPQEKRPRVRLDEYDHTEGSVWIFGSAHYNPVMTHYRETDEVVFLPTARNDGVLWPHQILVAALYDRFSKQWR